MPISYEIDKRTGTVMSKGFGTIALEDVLEFLQKTIHDPLRTTPYRELFDLRGAEDFLLTGDDVKSIVHYVEQRIEQLKFARVHMSRPGTLNMG